MVKRILHIVATLALVFGVLSCSNEKDRVIPRSKMARIYAEILEIDQWIFNDSKLRKMADTSLVYEPIFEKYGYNSDDYRRSVEYYMNDPERFSRILRSTSDILASRIEDLKTIQATLKRQEEIQRFVTDFEIGDFFPYLSSEPYVHYYDSLAVEYDSLMTYRLISIERKDTLYEGVRMIIKSQMDTNSVEEPLMGEDEAINAPKHSKSDTTAKEKVLQKEVDLKKDVVRFPDKSSLSERLLNNIKIDSLKRL